VLITTLGKVQRMAKKLAYRQRQGHQIFFAATDPREWFVFRRHSECYLKRYKLERLAETFEDLT
jgi:hypothetical protein